MRCLLSCVLIAIAMAIPPVVTHGHELETLKDSMSDEEYRRAGLDKLSPGELAALEKWLASRPEQPAPAPATAAASAASAVAVESAPAAPAPAAAADESIEDIGLIQDPKKQPKSFRSRIAGEFKGWKGETFFRLENGQLWQQRMEGRWTTDMDSPDVEISRGFFGYYNLKVLESGRWIGVKRIE